MDRQSEMESGELLFRRSPLHSFVFILRRRIGPRQHDIEAVFNPSVVVRIGGLGDVASLALPITLSLQLEGVVLKIKAGKILAVQAGSLQGVAEMKFQLKMIRPPLPAKDLFVPRKKKTEKFDFPAVIEFDEGYAIGPDRARA